MQRYILTLDAECKRRAPDPTSMQEISFCIRDARSSEACPVEWRKFRFRTDGEYAPGVLAWLRQQGLEDQFNRQEQENRDIDNAETVESMRQWLQEQVAKYPGLYILGYPIAFDWQYLNFYLHHYGGIHSENPLGYKGDDMDSLGRGLWGSEWDKTVEARLTKEAELQMFLIHYCDGLSPHDSLYDATLQSHMAWALTREYLMRDEGQAADVCRGADDSEDDEDDKTVMDRVWETSHLYCTIL